MSTPIHSMFASAADEARSGSSQSNNAGLPNYSRPIPHSNSQTALVESVDGGAAHQFDDVESNPRDSRRESFIDSDLEMRKYQHLAAGSSPLGYQAVGGHDVSEPGSPNVEAYERSHESGSSGTKVDGNSEPLRPRPETMSSDGSFDMRDARQSQGHTSESGGHIFNSHFYNNVNNPSATYGDQPQVGEYGDARYRHGSFGGGSGFESGRASTVGTDHIPGGNMPYNSSAVALNNEWRNDQGSDVSMKLAPGKEGMYGPSTPYGGAPYDSEKTMLNQSYVPLPPSSPALGINEKGGPPGGTREPPQVVLSRTNRLEWIDGLRGLASIVIFTHHFADLTWGTSRPETLGEGSLAGLLRNGQLAIGMYFLLGGRVLAASFLKSAFTIPKAPVVHGDDEPEKKVAPRKPAGPRWLSLSSSLFRRSIRLAFPAIVVGFIQWMVCLNGLMDTAMEAQEKVLAPSALWVPTWCQIGNFGGFLQFCLDLFTERNHQYMLQVGSALWSTYDQFWGSVIVYIVAAVVAPLKIRGRYLVYLIIVVSQWYYNSPNMLYIIGLWVADAHASGIVRKIQDHWKWVLAIECFAMGLALALIAGGQYVATPGNEAMGYFQVYDGKFGFNPRLVWPQYMLLSNWIPPTMILIWIELSHAMQWFVSWGIFRWIGKVSYGFYLMQFLTIYGLMPHLVLHFFNQGKSYWDIIVPTYIICLLFNFFVAWVSYHLLDRVGLKLGKWIWDGFFVSKPNTAAHLPLKMVRAMWWSITKWPGIAIKETAQDWVNKYHAFGKGFHTLMNWRTPTTRPAVSDPNDPEVLAQLHSTSWTADLGHDIEAVRTARLLRLQGFAWIPHLFIIPGLTAIWVVFHPTGAWTYEALTFSTLWRFFWVLSLPNCMFAFIGFITPDVSATKKQTAKKPVHREYIRNFFIVLVTKGSNEAAVRRGYNKLLKLEKYHPSVRVVVLTDEPYVYPDLQNIVCPKSYKSPLGKAKYKARALDYFRYHVSLGVYDWILHMDEESVTDGETVRRCLEFIRYTPHHFGQGIILYNGEGYWDNWYFTVADGIRVGDDLARFHLQNTLICRPVFGVHGSFLMTNGEMENECTWDFGSLAEDFEFSQDAWRRGFTCGRIHGIVREQSPTTLRDFLKQRRRWFMGIRDIKGVYGLPHLAVNLWIVGVFTLGVTILNLPLGFLDYSVTPLWIAVIADFCFVTFFTLYLWGLLFQELDYGTKWWKIIIHLPCAIVIQPFASVAEGISAIWAMSSEDFGKFEVIVKR